MIKLLLCVCAICSFPTLACEGQSETISLQRFVKPTNRDYSDANMQSRLGEGITLNYKCNGKYVVSEIDRAVHFLRDKQNGESLKSVSDHYVKDMGMLLDVMAEILKNVDYNGPFLIDDGYRSHMRALALKAKNPTAAKGTSPHSITAAADFYVPGYTQLGEVGCKKCSQALFHVIEKALHKHGLSQGKKQPYTAVGGIGAYCGKFHIDVRDAGPRRWGYPLRSLKLMLGKKPTKAELERNIRMPNGC